MRTAHSTTQPTVAKRKQPATAENQMMHQLRKYLRGRAQEGRVQRQNHQPLINPLLKRPLLLVLVRSYLFKPCFKLWREKLLKCTDSTGHKFGPGSATNTIYKTGTISACRRSVLPAFASNSAASLPTRSRFSKSTSPLVLFCTKLKPELYSTITPLPITTWSWDSLFWYLVKTIYSTH